MRASLSLLSACYALVTLCCSSGDSLPGTVSAGDGGAQAVGSSAAPGTSTAGDTSAGAGPAGAGASSGTGAAGGAAGAAIDQGGTPSSAGNGSGAASDGGEDGTNSGGASSADCDGEFSFERVTIDDEFTGECKALGDLNGDGLLDLAVGGAALKWYEAPSYTAYDVASAEHHFIGHMQAGDINGDGAVDLILPDGDYIHWFENPRGSGGDVYAEWERHLIGNQHFWAHELELGDFNLDGKLDVVTNPNLNLWLQGDSPAEWQNVALHSYADAEGLAVGDVDGDGRPDLAVRGHWVRTPGDPTKTGDYERYEIDDSMHDSVVIKIVDVDEDGTPDVAYAPKEDNIGEIVWYSAEDPTGPWSKHAVGPAGWAHEFAVVDFDGLGRKDFVFAEMAPSPTRRVGVFLQQPNGDFELEALAETGSHNIVVGDLGGDCDLDILGANWEAPPVEIFESKRCDRQHVSCP